VVCREEEAKGGRAEALAKAGAMLRRSSAWLSILRGRLLRRMERTGATDAPRLGAGSSTLISDEIMVIR
jgi:hypothetical protein